MSFFLMAISVLNPDIPRIDEALNDLVPGLLAPMSLNLLACHMHSCRLRSSLSLQMGHPALRTSQQRRRLHVPLGRGATSTFQFATPCLIISYPDLSA